MRSTATSRSMDRGGARRRESLGGAKPLLRDGEPARRNMVRPRRPSGRKLERRGTWESTLEPTAPGCGVGSGQTRTRKTCFRRSLRERSLIDAALALQRRPRLRNGRRRPGRERLAGRVADHGGADTNAAGELLTPHPGRRRDLRAVSRTTTYLGRAPMAVTSKRERALQVVLVVLGLLTAGANIYPLVTSLLALRPTGGTTAPMFYTVLATLGVFLVLAARNPSAHRSLIAYAVWSSVAHTAVMALMAIQLPTRRGELLAGVAVTGRGAVLLFVFARCSARSAGAVPATGSSA